MKNSPKRSILVLGSGFVAAPLVRYLLTETDHKVIVAGVEVERARNLIADHPTASALELDVQKDGARLEKLLQECSIAVSLLPYTLHVDVAQRCLKTGVNLVTTSYVSPAMQALHEEAAAKNLLLLNECGLDPGIDHMSAMKVIQETQAGGGKVLAFESCCGGLPAPEAADNPFRYKFSWSPRGVLLAGRNAAQYLRDGQIIQVESRALFPSHWRQTVAGLGDLEVYPNRNSLQYQELYGLTQARTVFRGTFRYPGWCAILEKIVQMGLLDDAQQTDLAQKTWQQVWRDKWQIDNPLDAMPHRLQLPVDDPVCASLAWLGLFDDACVNADTLLDGLTQLMQKKMAYQPGERDLVVLQHAFLIERANGRQQRMTSCLIDYGIPYGDSSMSRTVGLPAAVAVKQILAKRISLTGVQIPIRPEIYKPILQELAKMGIEFIETWHD
jgi:saccharopine dehydrogenase (NADP+, L-glutamate forming)